MSCDWKSTSAYAQARRLLLLSLLLAGVTPPGGHGIGRV